MCLSTILHNTRNKEINALLSIIDKIESMYPSNTLEGGYIETYDDVTDFAVDAIASLNLAKDCTNSKTRRKRVQKATKRVKTLISHLTAFHRLWQDTIVYLATICKMIRLANSPRIVDLDSDTDADAGSKAVVDTETELFAKLNTDPSFAELYANFTHDLQRVLYFVGYEVEVMELQFGDTITWAESYEYQLLKVLGTGILGVSEKHLDLWESLPIHAPRIAYRTMLHAVHCDHVRPLVDHINMMFSIVKEFMTEKNMLYYDLMPFNNSSRTLGNICLIICNLVTSNKSKAESNNFVDSLIAHIAEYNTLFQLHAASIAKAHTTKLPPLFFSDVKKYYELQLLPEQVRFNKKRSPVKITLAFPETEDHLLDDFPDSLMERGLKPVHPDDMKDNVIYSIYPVYEYDPVHPLPRPENIVDSVIDKAKSGAHRVHMFTRMDADHILGQLRSFTTIPRLEENMSIRTLYNSICDIKCLAGKCSDYFY